MAHRLTATVTLAALAAAPAALGQWVTFEDVTSIVLPASLNELRPWISSATAGSRWALVKVPALPS